MNTTEKKTLVLGGSENPERYSNKAIKLLRKKGYEVVSIGKRKGNVDDVTIHADLLHFEHIHTVTLYLNPINQVPFYKYILKLHPKRIIFNPGTENEVLKSMAESAGIQTEYACTLVLLTLNEY